MSSGTNPERLSQNNELLITNNEELVNLKTIIEALPETLDTTDATASVNDIVIDKTAYVRGEKITGIVPEAKANETIGTINMNATSYGDWGNGYRTLECRFERDTLQRENSVVTVPLTNPDMTIDLVAQMGITAEKIAVGNTILGIEGTASGLDTSDADATANDIASGLTAYVKGEKITGELLTLSTGQSTVDVASSVIQNDDTLVYYYKPNIDILLRPQCEIRISANNEDIADAIGLVPGMIVGGNTVLGVQGTATELDVTKTEIYDTTNNNIIVELDDLVLYKDQGVVGFRVNIPSSITQKEQILISGTGYIELQSFVLGTGCLCVRLNSIEELDTYIASDGEYVIIVNEANNYLGTYYYTAGAWSEVVSSTAYDNTLTETEYDEAVETTHTILGEEEI